MKRVAFGECVGWLHDAPGDTAVVLCATVGHEAMWSHRALRHLADDLAAAGVPALRFDYPGTGDAVGIDGAPGSMASWERAVVDAAAWMRRRTGARRLVLCGVRVGSLLAVLAAEAMAARADTRVDGLVLIAPPVAGRCWLQEMRTLHENWRDSVLAPHDPAPAANGPLPVLGYRFSADAVARLDALRLDDRPGTPARRVLLLDAWPGGGSPVAALAAHYQRAGACVTLADFPEYPRMMQCADVAAVPEQAWRDVLHWLGPVAPAKLPAPCLGRAAAAAATLAADGVNEWPLWLDGDRQFGILCTPPAHGGGTGATGGTGGTGGNRGGTVVIFPNSGGSHHVGDCRLFVTLSRQLARMGVAALRLDVSALGDTPLAAREVGSALLAGERPCRDVSAAVDCMRARGYDKVVLAGIGPGALASLHAALRNGGVDGLVLANLPAFHLGGARTGAGLMPPMRAWRAVLDRHARRWAGKCARVWGRVRGRVWGRVWARGCAHGWARAASGLASLRRSPGGPEGSRGAHAAAVPAATRFARSAMEQLHARGMRVDLLYGNGDIGLARAREHLGSGLAALAPLHRVHVRVLPWHDHRLWLPQSRDAFAAQLVLHVRGLAREAGTAGAMPPEFALSDP